MSEWPSAELKLPPPGWERVVEALWWLLFALAAAAIAGGAWRCVEEFRAAPAFARVGLHVEGEMGDECVRVVPGSRLSRAAWPAAIDPNKGGCLLSVDGRALGELLAVIAPLLEGTDGGAVTIRLKDPDGPATADTTLHRSAANAGEAKEPLWTVFEIGELVAFSLVAMLFAAVALLLLRRRRHDPVSIRISFAFLLILQGVSGLDVFWAWVGADWFGYVLTFIGLMLLITALPAYPDGIYVPHAARWFRLAAPSAVIGCIFVAEAIAPDEAENWDIGAFVVVLAVGLGLLLLRYYRMPAGLQRQQVKWAVFGITLGLLMLLITDIVPDSSGLYRTHPRLIDWLAGIFDLFTVLGLGLLPAGVGVSLLEYRLNDADAAAGKSIGYAIVTIVVGAVWAVVQLVVSDYAKRWAGDPMVTTAITTVVAALVFTPARLYVLAWTERKFQPALVHLRKLPEKLVRWQTCDSPDELAKAALADLVPGIGAAYAAVLGDDGRDWRVLAAHGIEPDKAAALLESERPAQRSDDPFPIRRELSDQLGRPDLLAIGPRSDGATFTGDEKAAIALIVEPLSDAIEAAALRERHIVKVENSLAGIDQRLARLEEGLRR